MRVEGTHEPVVPYELFVKANSILKQCEFKQSGRRERNIYCCGYCGRMMNSNKGAVVCGQRYYRQECDCRMPLRYNNDKRKKPLFSRGLSVCRHLFNSFSKLKYDEKIIK